MTGVAKGRGPGAPARAPRRGDLRGAGWRVAGLALCLTTLGPALHAQSPESGSRRPWPVVLSHHGRWVGVASSAGLLAVAAFRHHDADRAFDALHDRCRTSPDDCVRLPEGAYRLADAESQYQEARRLDRHAQLWLIGGQASLVLTGTMFLLDLIYRDDRPPNIPLSPLSLYSAPGKLGLATHF